MHLARLAYLLTAGLVAVTIMFLTLLKGSISVGTLWDADAHNIRSIDLIPFNGFIDPPIWYGPITNTVGNILMFAPVGLLIVLLWSVFSRSFHTSSSRRVILRSTLIGGFISLGIEVAQFIFAQGYSDIDDLLLNTLGTTLGAWLATVLHVEGRRYALAVVWAGCIIVLVLMLSGAIIS